MQKAEFEIPMLSDGGDQIARSESENHGLDSQIATDCHEFAVLEHNKIIEDWNQLGQNWITLTRRIQKFKQAKLFKYIPDPATGSTFTRFDAWAHCFLGHSVSKVFADLKTLRELKGVVSDPELALMSKQNAGHLARRKQQNQPVDAVILDDANHLKAAEFAARYPVQGTSEAGKSGPGLCKLGPFTVSETTAEIFSLALNIAKRHCEGVGQHEIDDALALIAQTFICAQEAPETGSGLRETPAGSTAPAPIVM